MQIFEYWVFDCILKDKKKGQEKFETLFVLVFDLFPLVLI